MTEPIIVGVDGSAASLHAAFWAGHEAAIREVPLRIVHAALKWGYDVPLVPQPESWEPGALTAAREMLREAAVRARTGRPEIEVETEIIDGGPVDALLGAARRAQLLVVGNRGRNAWAEILLGSVSRQIASQSPCPVAVIREAVVREGGVADQGEIVVGVTGQADQADVLDFAFQEALSRHARLRAVHAWVHPATRAPGDMQPLVYDLQGVGEEEARLLAETLAGWREKYPDVTFTQEVVHRHPARALVDASAHADMVVVGAHSRRRGPLGLGATAYAVLHYAHTSVVVVRHPMPRTSE